MWNFLKRIPPISWLVSMYASSTQYDRWLQRNDPRQTAPFLKSLGVTHLTANSGKRIFLRNELGLIERLMDIGFEQIDSDQPSLWYWKEYNIGVEVIQAIDWSVLKAAIEVSNLEYLELDAILETLKANIVFAEASWRPESQSIARGFRDPNNVPIEYYGGIPQDANAETRQEVYDFDNVTPIIKRQSS
jgi:hypothetical protein